MREESQAADSGHAIMQHAKMLVCTEHCAQVNGCSGLGGESHLDVDRLDAQRPEPRYFRHRGHLGCEVGRAVRPCTAGCGERVSCASNALLSPASTPPGSSGRGADGHGGDGQQRGEDGAGRSAGRQRMRARGRQYEGGSGK